MQYIFDRTYTAAVMRIGKTRFAAFKTYKNLLNGFCKAKDENPQNYIYAVVLRIAESAHVTTSDVG